MTLLPPSQGRDLGLPSLGLESPSALGTEEARQLEPIRFAPGEEAPAGAGPEDGRDVGGRGQGRRGVRLTRVLQWRQETGRKELLSWKLCTKPMRPPSTELDRRK